MYIHILFAREWWKNHPFTWDGGQVTKKLLMPSTVAIFLRFKAQKDYRLNE